METELHEPPAPIVNGRPTEIADSVFVVPDGHVPLVPNVGIVTGDRSALVVDTAMGPANGGRVLQFAEELARDRSLLLTITHFHPEHGFGAQAFLGRATIVYNREQLLELRQKGPSYLEMFRTFGPAVAEQLEGVELVDPHVVYQSEADIDLGGRAVQLRTLGLAHTRGDQVVFLPDERILFTGDLVENGFFPIFPYFPPEDADVDGSLWIEVLEQLARLEPRIVVPGHGEVGDVGLITAARECIAALRDETRRLAGQSLSADEIVAELDPVFRSRYPEWGQPEWIGFGVRCFYDAARG